jgi:hypothetical protein
MRRIFMVAVIILASVSAGAQDGSHPKLETFTGRVLDGDTGKPIAGALVHYLDDNPPVYTATNKPVRGITQGELTTGADGSFTLPADLPLASYKIRTEAPGYFAANLYDSQSFVGQRLPVGFPKPSHDLRLEPNHGMVALGASLFRSSSTRAPGGEAVLAATFAPDGGSLMLSLRGPALWVVTLKDSHAIRIELPAEMTTSKLSISQIGWDGHRLVFMANDIQGRGVMATAQAPEFAVKLVSLPDLGSVRVLIQPMSANSNYTLDEKDSCSETSGPHCGQSGMLVAHEINSRKLVTVKQGSSGDMTYALWGDLVAFHDPEQTMRVQKSALALMNLDTGARSRVVVPYAQFVKMLASVAATEASQRVMRVAYSHEGDCDPNTTDKAQPFAPGGPAGFTENSWSVCVVSMPFPGEQPVVRKSATRRKEGNSR